MDASHSTRLRSCCFWANRRLGTSKVVIREGCPESDDIEREKYEINNEPEHRHSVAVSVDLSWDENGVVYSAVIEMFGVGDDYYGIMTVVPKEISERYAETFENVLHSLQFPMLRVNPHLLDSDRWLCSELGLGVYLVR